MMSKNNVCTPVGKFLCKFALEICWLKRIFNTPVHVDHYNIKFFACFLDTCFYFLLSLRLQQDKFRIFWQRQAVCQLRHTDKTEGDAVFLDGTDSAVILFI